MSASPLDPPVVECLAVGGISWKIHFPHPIPLNCPLRVRLGYNYDPGNADDAQECQGSDHKPGD